MILFCASTIENYTVASPVLEIRYSVENILVGLYIN